MYKRKWINLIDSIPTSGSDSQLIALRDQLEAGERLWAGQEQLILDKLEGLGRQVSKKNVLTEPLPIEELREMYRAARRARDHQALHILERLGKASARGEAPSIEDLMTYRRLKKSLIG